MRNAASARSGLKDCDLRRLGAVARLEAPAGGRDPEVQVLFRTENADPFAERIPERRGPSASYVRIPARIRGGSFFLGQVLAANGIGARLRRGAFRTDAAFAARIPMLPLSISCLASNTA